MMKMNWLKKSWSVVIVLIAGCGGSAVPTSESDATTEKRAAVSAVTPSESEESDESSGVIPTSATELNAAVGSRENEADDAPFARPDKDSAEAFILRITQLKLKPLIDASDVDSQNPEKLTELRKQRNEQLIDLATEAIARTHKETDKDEDKKRVFDLAVHYLLESELQLALTGEQEHIDAIHEHATSLYERDPKSKAAVEAGQTLIAFMRTNSQRYGQQEPKWLEEYSRLARQFSKKFPQEERLAIPMLFSVGQSCENHGLKTEAMQCYATICEQFPENPAAERATPILRRLSIKGKPLQLAGPTLGGGFIKAEELIGRPLLVVFWKTSAQPFVRQLASLKDLLEQISSDRLNIVSVNLDDDDNEVAVQAFLEANGLNWPTIFQAEPEQRGWNNPNATHYGINSVPQYWVVSAKGNVVETANDVKQIEPLLQKLITPPSPSGENAK